MGDSFFMNLNDDWLSPDFHARAAATRVLCYWRDQVKEPLELLRVQINDAHPRVRLEASGRVIAELV